MPFRLPGGQQAAFGYRAVDLDGQPVAGLLISDFTVSLRYENVAGTSVYADAGETVSLVETGAVAGWYEFRFTPTRERRYVLTITPTFAGAAGGAEVHAVDFYAASVASPTAYGTVSQVRAYLGSYTDQETSDDALIDTLLRNATATIDGYTGRTFGLEQLTEYPRVGSSSEIVLRKYPVAASPPIQVHESRELPRVYDATTALVEGTDFFVDYESGVLTHPTRNWASGPKSVRVIYQAGYAEVPAEVSWCCVYLAALWLLGRRFVGIAGANSPDGSVTRFDHDRLPWMVKDILDRYRKVA